MIKVITYGTYDPHILADCFQIEVLQAAVAIYSEDSQEMQGGVVWLGLICMMVRILHTVASPKSNASMFKDH